MTQVVDTDANQSGTVFARERAESTNLVTALRGGDPNAFGKLYDLWFDRVFDVANRIVRDQHDAAEVAQDAFLSAWRNIGGLEDPAAFGGWVLRISRNLAFNRRKKEQRSTPLDGEGMGVVEATQGPSAAGPAGFSVEEKLSRAESPERAAEDADLCDLLWEAAEALGERDASVLDLHLRRDLTPAEIAEELGITRNNANQLVHRLKQRLGMAVKSRVLWHGGKPACVTLGAELESAGVVAFGKDTVDLISRHVTVCADCSSRQATRVAPAALFAATPLLLAPVVLKQQVAAGLEADGAQMEGSHYADDGHHGVWSADDHHVADSHGHDDPGAHHGDPHADGAAHQPDAQDHGQDHGHDHDPGHEPGHDPLHHDVAHADHHDPFDPLHQDEHGLDHGDHHDLLHHDDPQHPDAHHDPADPQHDPHHHDPGHDPGHGFFH